jgi:glyoxylase-like metal-dependent hydrolase (beta-lactamase superfamily II)
VLSFETGDGGERRVRVAYTPGHASHHVSYLDEASGTAFVGDTAGQRTAGVDYVWPVTPPPDVDLEAWHDSLDTLRAWEADTLFCTHFGPHDDPAAHLDRMDERLRQWGQDARALLYDDDHQHESDEARADAFDAEKIEAMRAAVPEEDRTPYENFGRPRESWHGLARYWRTHGEGDAA